MIIRANDLSTKGNENGNDPRVIKKRLKKKKDTETINIQVQNRISKENRDLLQGLKSKGRLAQTS